MVVHFVTNQWGYVKKSWYILKEFREGSLLSQTGAVAIKRCAAWHNIGRFDSQREAWAAAGLS